MTEHGAESHTHTLSYSLQMKLALAALAAVLLLALLLVGSRRVTGVKPNLVPEWSEPAIDLRPVPMVIEPEWSEPAIDNRLATVVAEPVMQATKSRPGWLSRNKYKVGLGGLMLLSVARRMSNWQSIPTPSFSDFQPRVQARHYNTIHHQNHFDTTPHDSYYDAVEENDW